MADMATLHYLNAFISERLTAAAVEIFGAVEKTLTEYQGEISRSKQEIDHLKTLVLWPQVKLHRSGRWIKKRCNVFMSHFRFQCEFKVSVVYFYL